MWFYFLVFCVLGFGTASLDDSSLRQNGYSQNRHVKDAHQVLDRNLGKQENALILTPQDGKYNFVDFLLKNDNVFESFR